MKNKAVNALIEMGMPANIKGFQYIAEAMELISTEVRWRPGTGNVTRLYQKLAEIYGDTPSRVERAIRHAFSIVLTRRNLKTAEKYLDLQNTTNGNLLTVFFLRLSQEGAIV